jgi:rhamnogalacturonan endolyase
MSETNLKRILILAVLFLTGTAARSRAADQGQPVVVSEDAGTATLSNGVIRATVNKLNGNLLSLKSGGLDLLSHGGAYWNCYGEIPGNTKTQEKPGPSEFRICQDPKQNGGATGEVALRFPYHGQAEAVPMDIEIRYTLRRGDSGLYGWTIIHHEPANPGFNIEAGTLCLKLNPKIFDFLSVDTNRQREMITGEDWVNGTQMNLWEARLMNTGIHKGEVEHKYDYSAMFSQTPAYGWSSSTDGVGLWIVNPSIEYIIAPPIKVDLTGHIDIKPSLPADPTLLFVWHSNHYGGEDININSSDNWTKIIGPILCYCNHGSSHEAMWKDALERAAREQKQWPYAWADAPGYERANERGSARGQLVVRDPQAPQASAAGAWVGLAQPPYAATFDRGRKAQIDWQIDGKNYQYWARADTTGHFTIPNVRPGSYALYAFTDGVLGDFSRADVRVAEGKTTDLGELIWTPVRYGRQLWDIGIPNRSAEEFRHGDHYWQWGLYNLYPQEFPNDVDFVIGKSDFRHDWNYAQPPRPDAKGGWKNTTWRIRFSLDKALKGTAILRLAICGARGGPVDATVNGKSIGSTGELPNMGVMHRDGIRSVEVERDLKFDASLLKPGENVIGLAKHVRTWTDGVLYDYIRLELNSQTAFAP